MTQIVNINKVQTITSLEIAELTGKQHFHLMRDIRKMEIAWEKVTQSKFGCSTYKDATGRTLPCYVLTKTECLYIATKFNDEARAKLVLRWEELEMAEVRRKMADVPCLPEPQKILALADEIIGEGLADSNLTRLRTHVSYSLKGQKKIKVYMTWTMDGLRFLNAKLGYPNF
jgi:Rha family phage regulatory protein